MVHGTETGAGAIGSEGTELTNDPNQLKTDTALFYLLHFACVCYSYSPSS